MAIEFKVINVNLTSAISDDPIEEVPCGDCSFCCQKLSPHLTPDEISSGKYPISLVEPLKDSNLNLGPTIVLYKNKSGGCSMLVEGKCLIYNSRPLSCRQFDCRKGHHPSIPDMTQK